MLQRYCGERESLILLFLGNGPIRIEQILLTVLLIVLDVMVNSYVLTGWCKDNFEVLIILEDLLVI